MFGSAAMDVAVGLFVFYFLLSVICTQINEYVAGVIGLRASVLRRGLEGLLSGELADSVWGHPLIRALGRGKFEPSYIPSTTFSLALLDVLAPGNTRDLSSISAALAKRVEAGDQSAKALTAIVNAARDLDSARTGIAVWFDQTMDRVSGAYKRRLQLLTLLVSVAVTFLVGADTFAIANTLWTNQGVRSSLATTAVTGEETLDAAVDALGTFEIPLGWVDWPYDAFSWGYKLVGLFLTTMAVALGAPFWFDVLKRVSNMRSTGPPPPDARDVARVESPL
jgi:hypothetical protein